MDEWLFEEPKEQLETVNEAIYAILKGGQSYKIGSRSLTRADLGMLYKMQKQLRSELANAGNGSLFSDTVVGVFDGR